MCRKTMIRVLLNSGYAPLSQEVRTALAEDAESGGEGLIPDIPMPANVVPSTGEVLDDGPENVTAAEEAPPETASGRDSDSHAGKKNAAQTRADGADVSYAESFFD